MARSLNVHFVHRTRADLDDFLEFLAHSTPEGIFNEVYGGSLSLLDQHPSFFKKWWMVEHLLDLYEYFYVFDSEVAFTKPHDAYEIANKIATQKHLYGVVTTCVSGIVTRAMWRYTDAEKERLLKLTAGGTLYLFNNEIFIVESRSARNFLREYNITSTSTGPGDFEELVYIYYMILREGWVVTDLTAVTGARCVSLGEEGGGNAEALRISDTHLASRSAWVHDRQKFSENDIVATFHRDRFNN